MMCSKKSPNTKYFLLCWGKPYVCYFYLLLFLLHFSHFFHRALLIDTNAFGGNKGTSVAIAVSLVIVNISSTGIAFYYVCECNRLLDQVGVF